MKDNKYCRIVSETVLSENKKAEIKRAMTLSVKKDKKTEITAVSPVAVRKRRIKTYSLAAAVLVLVIGASWHLSSFINIFKVNDPIPAEEYLHMCSVAENAQYLPNEQILASSGEAEALYAEIPLDESKDHDDFYKYVYKSDPGQLDFNLDDYRTLNDSLAVINSTATDGEMTIYDIKEEINVAMEIVPGYDQWFRLDMDLPYLSEIKGRQYGGNSYKISYDKENEIITVERIGGRTRGESYDIVNDVFYDSTSSNYQRQYFKVVYYFDEEGREVVDCTVINYVRTDNSYYPVSSQRLINVKDCSLTKYAATYMRKAEVVDPQKFNDNDDLYDLTNMYDHGINVITVQLNYDSPDDITLLKSYYESPDKHFGIATTGELSYYRKTADETTYFTSGWDNRGTDLEGPIRVSNGVQVYNDTLIHSKLVESFAEMSDIRYNMMCEECSESKPSSDGVFIDCTHGVLLSVVNRTKNQIFSDSEKILSDSSIVLDGIELQIMRFADSLEVGTFLEIDESGENAFETSVNDFIVAFGKEYYQQVQSIGYGDIDKYAYKHASKMEEKNMAEYMKDRYSFTYDTKSNTKLDGSNVVLNIQTNVSILDDDSDSEYYLAIILQSLYASEDEYFIVEKYLTDTESGKVEISDTVSFQSLVEAIVSKGNHDTFNSFRLAYVIIKESDNGTELVTMSRTVKTYYDDKTDPIRETLTCEYNGKTVFYKIISCNGGIAIRLQ